MTNADVIRRMADDELYEFLSEWECGDIDYAVTFCDLCKGGGNELNLDCDGCRKHWLTRNAVEYGGLFYWKRNKDFTDRKTESNSEIPNNCEVKNYCDDCLYADTCDSKEFFYACTSKATISKMEQVEDEPQKTTDYCDICKGDMCEICVADATNPYCVPSHYEINYEPKDEPQSERSEKIEFRTLDGMIGYADGYNLCFKQFCDYLKNHDKDEAIRKMNLLVTAVNSVVSDEKRTDCPKCGRTDYIRDMEKDMGIKGSDYKYKCINCNTYIKDEPQTEDGIMPEVKAGVRFDENNKTLWIKTDTVENYDRVIIEDGSNWCRIFYEECGECAHNKPRSNDEPQTDEDEPQACIYDRLRDYEYDLALDQLEGSNL